MATTNWFEQDHTVKRDESNPADPYHKFDRLYYPLGRYNKPDFKAKKDSTLEFADSAHTIPTMRLYTSLKSHDHANSFSASFLLTLGNCLALRSGVRLGKAPDCGIIRALTDDCLMNGDEQLTRRQLQLFRSAQWLGSLGIH